MTEREAKTKWCPMARTVMGGFVINKTPDGLVPIPARCIGNACACWIWNGERNITVATGIPEHKVQEEIEKQKKDKLTFLYEVSDGHTEVTDAPNVITYSLYFEKEPEKRQGHCGLCK